MSVGVSSMRLSNGDVLVQYRRADGTETHGMGDDHHPEVKAILEALRGAGITTRFSLLLQGVICTGIQEEG